MKSGAIAFGVVLALTSGLALAQEQQGKTDKPEQQKSDKQGASKAKTEPVVITVMTVSVAESTGCWARIHDGHNFTGRTLTLSGAQRLPNLEFGIGTDWEGDIDSVEVGPKAKLVLFEDENFMDKKQELKANDRVADLHKSAVSEGVESIELTCTQS